MVKHVEFIWRWFATIFSFFIFGVGGVLLGLIVYPTLLLLPASSAQRSQRAKLVIHKTFRFYIEIMRLLGVLTYEIQHLERLKDAQLVLANHPSLIDVVFLIAFIPNANCVVKGKLTRNIFTRGPIKMAGYIINEESENVVDLARNALEQKDTLIVFPEGTRSVPNTPLSLKRGAAQVALRVPAAITPVIIQSYPSTLTKQDRWYQIPHKRVHFSLTINPVIPVQPYLEEIPLSVAARRLSTNLTRYFNQELNLNVSTE